MTDPQKRTEAPDALVRLMTQNFNPDGLTDDELVEAAVKARDTKKKTELAVAAALARRNWSWRQIGKALGVDHSTAYGWVRDAGLLPTPEPGTKDEQS